MKIELLSEDNLKDLIPFVLELWPECIEHEELENYKAVMNSSDEVCYLVKTGDGYSGFVYAALRKDYVEGSSSSPVAYIEGIYVRPALQRTGVGKKLIEAAETWARNKGCTELGSDTELSNIRSISFHQHAGFEEASRIVCFIKKM